MSRTENLIHALGSITALCCTDKKGILSWPNTSAEKLFILKNDDCTIAPMASSENILKDNENDKQEVRNIVPEILTITHDHR